MPWFGSDSERINGKLDLHDTMIGNLRDRVVEIHEKINAVDRENSDLTARIQDLEIRMQQIEDHTGTATPPKFKRRRRPNNPQPSASGEATMPPATVGFTVGEDTMPPATVGFTVGESASRPAASGVQNLVPAQPGPETQPEPLSDSANSWHKGSAAIPGWPGRGGTRGGGGSRRRKSKIKSKKRKTKRKSR